MLGVLSFFINVICHYYQQTFYAGICFNLSFPPLTGLSILPAQTVLITVALHWEHRVWRALSYRYFRELVPTLPLLIYTSICPMISLIQQSLEPLINKYWWKSWQVPLRLGRQIKFMKQAKSYPVVSQITNIPALPYASSGGGMSFFPCPWCDPYPCFPLGWKT